MTRLEELYAERVAIARRWDELAAEIRAEEASDDTHLAAMEDRLCRYVIEDAARLYGVTLDRVLGPSRDRRVVQARQGAMWLLRQRGLSLPTIGGIMGRDHTTVLHGCRSVDSKPSVRALLAPLLPEVAA